MGRASPALNVGWVPHRLIFLARGNAPFTLAYGSTVVEKNDASVENVLRIIEEKKKTAVTGKAKIENRIVLGGDEALENRHMVISWKTWILWAILVTAVFLLGFMALRLYREINNPYPCQIKARSNDQLLYDCFVIYLFIALGGYIPGLNPPSFLLPV